MDVNYKESLDEYDIEDKLMTVKEVAEFLQVNKNTVYGLIRAGKLPSIKLGSLKVLKSSLIKTLWKYECCDISDPEKIVSLKQYYM